MRTERERVRGCNPGLSDQQQATTHTATGNHNPVPPYRVTWFYRGGEPQERVHENYDSARVRFASILRSQSDLIDLTLERWMGEAWGNRWHTHLALCCGVVHTSATPDGARHISHLAAHRRGGRSLDETAAGRRGAVALTVAIIHWNDAGLGGGGAA